MTLELNEKVRQNEGTKLELVKYQERLEDQKRLADGSRNELSKLRNELDE